MFSNKPTRNQQRWYTWPDDRQIYITEAEFTFTTGPKLIRAFSVPKPAPFPIFDISCCWPKPQKKEEKKAIGSEKSRIRPKCQF